MHDQHVFFCMFFNRKQRSQQHQSADEANASAQCATPYLELLGSKGEERETQS